MTYSITALWTSLEWAASAGTVFGCTVFGWKDFCGSTALTITSIRKIIMQTHCQAPPTSLLVHSLARLRCGVAWGTFPSTAGQSIQHESPEEKSTFPCRERSVLRKTYIWTVLRATSGRLRVGQSESSDAILSGHCKLDLDDGHLPRTTRRQTEGLSQYFDFPGPILTPATDNNKPHPSPQTPLRHGPTHLRPSSSTHPPQPLLSLHPTHSHVETLGPKGLRPSIRFSRHY